MRLASLARFRRSPAASPGRLHDGPGLHSPDAARGPAAISPRPAGRTRVGRHSRRRGAADRAGPRHSRPVVGRVPVAAARQPDRTALVANPDIQAAVGGAAGRPIQRPRAARHPVSHRAGGLLRHAEPGADASCRRRSPPTELHLRPVHARPHHQLHARPVGRQPAGDRIARRAGRGAVLPARGAPICRSPSNVVAAAILEASLRSQIDVTQRIIAAQRETLGILRQQRGPGRHHRRRRRRAGGRARPGRGDPAAAAEGAGAAAQPAGHPDRPFAERIAGRAFELADLSCRRTCRSACRRSWSSSGPTCARPRPTCIRVGAGRRRDRQPVPQITLNAGISTHGAGPRPAVRPGLRGSNVGANVLQTVLDGGALVRQEEGGAGGAGAGRRAVSLDRAHRLPQRRRHAARAGVRRPHAEGRGRRRAAAATSFTIARRRLELGDTTYVFVLIAELAYQQALLLACRRRPALSPTRRPVPGAGRRLVESGRRTLPIPPRLRPLGLPHLRRQRRHCRDSDARMRAFRIHAVRHP